MSGRSANFLSRMFRALAVAAALAVGTAEPRALAEGEPGYQGLLPQPLLALQPLPPTASSNLPTLPETVVEAAPSNQPSQQPSDTFAPPPQQPPQPAESPFAAFTRGTDLLDTTSNASSGVFSQIDLKDRPLLRPGSVLELIPGTVVTQHSGSGKANQYF